MQTNIFAWTAPGASYPEYLSINECEGRIEVTVRAPNRGSAAGHTATMVLPLEAFSALAATLPNWRGAPERSLKGSG